MKIKKDLKNKVFEPFTIEIKIENKLQALALLDLFNHTSNALKSRTQIGLNIDERVDGKSFSDDMFDAFEGFLIEEGVL